MAVSAPWDSKQPTELELECRKTEERHEFAGDRRDFENQRLANAVGVQSTPSFAIGNELISGAMDLSRFEELISKHRTR